MQGLRTRSVVWLAGGLLAVSSAARADDCAAVTAAAIAQAKIPHAGTMAITHPGKPADTSATVVTATTAYAQVSGVWQAMPYSVQKEIDRINRVSREASRRCSTAGAEAVDGEEATIYTTHASIRDAAGDTRLWVSDRSGLPLKTETRFQDGMTLVATYRYDNVEAPAGVK